MTIYEEKFPSFLQEFPLMHEDEKEIMMTALHMAYNEGIVEGMNPMISDAKKTEILEATFAKVDVIHNKYCKHDDCNHAKKLEGDKPKSDS